MKKTTLLFAFFGLLSAYAIAQPSNDLCSGATTLPVGATCINTLVTFDGTAADSGVSDPGCADYVGGDLWYSLTVPASGIVSVVASTDDGSLTIAGMAIYTGADCNSLTKLTCAFNNGGGGFPSAKISQPAGSTIYVRVWDLDNDAVGTFNLCATEVPAIPAVPSNDASSGAIDLTVGATCSNTLVTIDGTETDSGLGDPGCARYVGGDLWYKVTVPASGNVKIETDTNDSSITDGGMAVYTGPDANTLTLLECDDRGNTDSLEDFERINVLGRTPGEVVYVRVWSFNNPQGSFNICALEFHPLNNEKVDVSSFSMYPNPVKDIVNISFKNGVNIDSKIRVYDLQGKLVVNNRVTNNQTTIDISKFPRGLYFLKFENGHDTVTQKLIVE